MLNLRKELALTKRLPFFESMSPVIPFIIALVVALVAIYWIILKSSAEKIGVQYQLLAQRFELELEQPEPKMAGLLRPEPSVYGHYRGREISISVPGKGLQNTRQVESVLKIGLNDKDLKAQFVATGPLAGMRQRDSGKQARWKSGDEPFDSAIDVRTNHGGALKPLLTEERRVWLARTLKKSKATLYIGGGTLAYAKLGLIANEATRQDFESAVEFLCDLAETVESKVSLKNKASITP
jgi:hypothetical protein